MYFFLVYIVDNDRLYYRNVQSYSVQNIYFIMHPAVLALLFIIRLKLKRSQNGFGYFHNIYGAEGLQLFKNAHNASVKLSKLKMDLEFLT